MNILEFEIFYYKIILKIFQTNMHLFSQGDNLKQFGWNKHDGVNFGIQTIIDRSVNITTSFIKTPGGQFGGDWSNRIDVKTLRKKDSDDMEIGLLYYVALEDSESKLVPVYADDGSLAEIRGTSPGLGSWRLWWKVSINNLCCKKVVVLFLFKC